VLARSASSAKVGARALWGAPNVDTPTTLVASEATHGPGTSECHELERLVLGPVQPVVDLIVCDVVHGYCGEGICLFVYYVHYKYET